MKPRLYRSIRNKKIGGVCAGLAEYFEIDIALVRVAFVLGVILHGIGLLGYIILWIAVPENPQEFTHPNVAGMPDTMSFESTSSQRHKRQGALIAGSALILAGFYFLLDNLFPWIDLSDYSPVFLIAAGVLILVYGFVGRNNVPQTFATSTPFTAAANDSQDEHGGVS